MWREISTREAAVPTDVPWRGRRCHAVHGGQRPMQGHAALRWPLARPMGHGPATRPRAMPQHARRLQLSVVVHVLRPRLYCRRALPGRVLAGRVHGCACLWSGQGAECRDCAAMPMPMCSRAQHLTKGERTMPVWTHDMASCTAHSAAAAAAAAGTTGAPVQAQRGRYTSLPTARRRVGPPTGALCRPRPMGLLAVMAMHCI